MAHSRRREDGRPFTSKEGLARLQCTWFPGARAASPLGVPCGWRGCPRSPAPGPCVLTTVAPGLHCWHQVLKPRCPPWNRVSPPEVHFHEPPGDKNRAGAADLACSERGMPALESRQPAASLLKAVSPTFRDLCPGPLPFTVLQNSLALEGFLLPPGQPALSRSLHPLSLSVPLASSVSGGAGSKLSPAFLAWT